MSTTLALGGFNERAPLRQCAVEELDGEQLSTFARELFGDTADTERIALRAGLVAKSGQHIHPTAVGLLCFGGLPQLLFPQWGVSCVRVRGRTISDPVVAQLDLEGPIPQLLSQSLAFLTLHTGMVDAAQVTDLTQQVYAPEAMRELIVNALIHRDLKRTARIAIFIFDDRVVIRSPGGPVCEPQMLELLSTEGGRSIPRNPLLVSIVRRLGLCDQIGRGLTHARRLSAALTRTPLQIEASSHDLSVIVPSAWSAQTAN